MREVELLAPAGDLEKLKIAFIYGADAVYIGGEVFGMRSAAKNFSKEDMIEGVEFAHSMGKRVFVTVNIIPRSEDIDALTDYIKELSEIYEGQDDVVIGAGTVLDAETARAAMLAGAKYIVSPAFDLETAKICNRYKVPYLPGIMTINEIITAHEAGVDFVKLFPGSAFGQGYVKAIKGPLPYANIMVTGGVNIDNIDSWIKAGVDAVGIGGELNKLGEEGKFEEITAVCEQYMAKLNEARGC